MIGGKRQTSAPSLAPSLVTASSIAVATRSKSWPRPKTPGTPVARRWPFLRSASRYSRSAGFSELSMVASLLVFVDEQHRRVGGEDAVVGDHQLGAVRVAQVAGDGDLRVVLVAGDAADGERA